MIGNISSPITDLTVGYTPEEVSAKYNIPLQKVIEVNEKLIEILDDDTKTDGDLFELCEQYELF